MEINEPKRYKVKRFKSLDRHNHYLTPTRLHQISETRYEMRCPYFSKRFMGSGNMGPYEDIIAVCEDIEEQALCDYRNKRSSGVCECFRYWIPKIEDLKKIEVTNQKLEFIMYSVRVIDGVEGNYPVPITLTILQKDLDEQKKAQEDDPTITDYIFTTEYEAASEEKVLSIFLNEVQFETDDRFVIRHNGIAKADEIEVRKDWAHNFDPTIQMVAGDKIEISYYIEVGKAIDRSLPVDYYFSTKFVDTHEKEFSTKGNKLSWKTDT